MQVHIFDDKNYNPSWRRIEREAVRAVIVRGSRIALVKSRKESFYKFPGGGIQPGETHLETLCRETREETGLHIIPDSVREFGLLREIRRGLYGEEIFDQKSYYYLADVSHRSTQELDDYEAELGYELVWPGIEEAYRVNISLSGNYQTSFLQREAYMLKLLMDSTVYGAK
jgi:8-oxo-dGTP pyrophosphatase MutT (NUDIX family)